MRRFIWIPLALAICALIIEPASAASQLLDGTSGRMLHSDSARLADIVDRSDVILSARITSSEGYWNDDRTLIETRYALEVIQSFLDTSDTPVLAVDLVVLGGEVGDLRLEVSGQPDLQVGGTYMLFLQEPAAASASVRVVACSRIAEGSLERDELAAAVRRAIRLRVNGDAQ